MNQLLIAMSAALTGMMLSSMSMSAAAGPDLVPVPAKCEMGSGSFKLGPRTRILTDAVTRDAAIYLANQLRSATGLKLEMEDLAGRPQPKDTILLRTGLAAAKPAEGAYELAVSTEGASLIGADSAGAFNAVQTFLQLLPPRVYSRATAKGIDWQAPCVTIQDAPRFQWRGLLVDVARHFFTVDEMKRFMDMMAVHKLNRLQVHFTDDQGWRVEIRKYPRLTEVGGWRDGIGFNLDPKSSTAYGPDGRYGGFFTRAQIRDLVAYAEARHITIVPEIEMPGHAGAALRAYPQFSCSGKGGGFFCPGKDETFAFLENILSEAVDLFPGKYIHIGGDEVNKETWKACTDCQARIRKEGLKNEHELQSYFVRRIEKIVNARGRIMIGWSEIREGGLSPNATLMDWIGGGVEAASSGHDVIMSPTTHCYLDYYQSEDKASEPAGIGGFVPLKQVYSFEPVPAGLAPRFVPRILGAQGNLWTEFIASLSHLEYMALPRASALAEVAWSPKEARDWDAFLRRMKTHRQRLDALGVNYRKGDLAAQ